MRKWVSALQLIVALVLLGLMLPRVMPEIFGDRFPDLTALSKKLGPLTTILMIVSIRFLSYADQRWPKKPLPSSPSPQSDV